MKSGVLILAVLLVVALSPLWGGGSGLYPWPTNWSFGGVASWSQPLIASGAALPAVGSGAAGDLFHLVDAASWTAYRHDGSGWVQQVASGSGGGGAGTTNHAGLSNLAFADSGHTGFASEPALNDHIADQVDPHGASTTFRERVTVGSGTADAFLWRIATGTVGIASYAALPAETATPPVASGVMVLWNDANTGKLRVHDGDNTWHDLW